MNMERAWIPAGVSPAERRRLFSIWIRTGRIPTRRDDGVELKFNPWHDPRDGRFTSGPGGEAASRDGPPDFQCCGMSEPKTPRARPTASCTQ